MQKICLIGLSLFLNTSNAIPEGTTKMKACTFHGETFAIIQPIDDCPVPQDIILEAPDPYINDNHPKHQAHNPECFGYHFIFR